MELRLNHILFTVFTAIAAIPVALLALWVHHLALTQEIEAVQDKHLLVARNLTHALSRYTTDIRTVFSNISHEILATGPKPAHGDLLSGMQIRHLWILDADLEPIRELDTGASPGQHAPPGRLLEQLQPELALSRQHPDQVVFSNLLPDADGDPVLVLLQALPGQHLAVAILGTDYVQQVQQHIAFGKRGHAAIFDKTGRVMAHPLPAWRKAMKDVSGLPPVQAMMQGKTGVISFYTPAMQADMIAGYTTVPEVGWGVMVPQPMEELHEHIISVRLIAAGIALAGMTFAALLAWRLSNQLAMPIARVVESARHAARGKLSTRVVLTQKFLPEELRNLSDTFNQMLDEITLKTRDLKTSNLRLAEAQRVARMGNWEWDITNGSFWHSDEVARILGHERPRSQLPRKQLLRQVHPDDLNRVNNASRRVLRDHRPYKLEYRVILPDGQIRHVYQETEAILGKDGKPRRLIGTLRDITERKEYERQLEWQATHDELTRLPNRRQFMLQIEDAIGDARASGTRVALLYIDLDGLHNINTTLGHAAGDQVLRTAAKRLADLPHLHDLARGGGDEFTIVIRDLQSTQQAEELAQQIIQLFNRALMVDGYEIFISCSIGITVYPEDAQTPQSMLRNAHIATYAAKEAGRNAYRCFTRELQQANQRRSQIRNALRTALERNEFAVHYQPIVDVTSGEIYGAEALVRWEHPQMGQISPGEFIPLAEETGVINPLGKWILQTACAQVAQWRRRYDRELHISVNLSTRQLELGLTAADITDILEAARLPPGQLSLEITESLVLDDAEQTIAWLNSARRAGIHFSIDDFGTGYSSLSYLNRIPADTVKIDRSFITNIEDTNDGVELLGAIIALARSLNLKMIAEGVENQAQLDYLRGQQCDLVQGFYFSRPLPARAFEKLLDNSQATPMAV